MNLKKFITAFVIFAVFELVGPHATDLFYSQDDKKIVDLVIESVYTSDFSKIKDFSTRDLTEQSFYQNINTWNLSLPEKPQKTQLLQKKYVSEGGRPDFIELTLTLFFPNSEKSQLYVKTSTFENKRYIENINIHQIQQSLVSVILGYALSFIGYVVMVYIGGWIYQKIKKKKAA